MFHQELQVNPLTGVPYGIVKRSLIKQSFLTEAKNVSAVLALIDLYEKGVLRDMSGLPYANWEAFERTDCEYIPPEENPLVYVEDNTLFLGFNPGTMVWRNEETSYVYVGVDSIKVLMSPTISLGALSYKNLCFHDHEHRVENHRGYDVPNHWRLKGN